MSQMTVEQLVDETVEYYRTNPRSYNALRMCVYENGDGAMCAVGRCMTDPKTIQSETGGCSYGALVEMVKEGNYIGIPAFDQVLKPEYAHIKDVVWVELQHLHDHDSYWTVNDDGGWDLSPDGKEMADTIKRLHGN